MSVKVTVHEAANSSLVEGLLCSVGVSSPARSELIDKILHKIILLERIEPSRAEFLRQEMANRGGVAVISRTDQGHANVILSGSIVQFTGLLHILSSLRGFELIVEAIAKVQNSKDEIDSRWRIGRRILQLNKKPLIMGILNVTPDSFSDGNRYQSPDQILDRALQMEEEGADIIDVGGESTRPDATPVSAEEELRRVIPVLERLSGRLKAPLSIDTYKGDVAKEAVAAGAEIINDISGLSFDETLAGVAASSGAGLVLMHTRGTPGEMQLDTGYDNIIAEISGFLARAVLLAENAGIERSRIVLDPGIGFGKDVCGNITILRHLKEFKALGRPLLVGTSRKGFIGRILGREVGDRGYGTAATVAMSLVNGASIFRVHDVREMRDVLDMTAAILSYPAADA